MSTRIERNLHQLKSFRTKLTSDKGLNKIVELKVNFVLIKQKEFLIYILKYQENGEK